MIPKTRSPRPARTRCRLPPAKLRACCDPQSLPFGTTAELVPLDEPMGQHRATAAIDFAIAMRAPGYNLFALGPEGTGKTILIRRVLERIAAAQQPPDDWVYLFNFVHPHRPVAVRLPAGRGHRLRRDMLDLVSEVRMVVPAVFDSEDYRLRRQRIEAQFKRQRESSLGAIEDRAEAEGIAMIRSVIGLGFAPLIDGRPMTPHEFEALPEPGKGHFLARIEIYQQELEAGLEELPQWTRQQRQRLSQLDEDAVRAAIAPIFGEHRRTWADLPAVIDHLEMMEEDILDNLDQFADRDSRLVEEGGLRPPRPVPTQEFRRYRVNVLVGEADGGERGAPVIYEAHPTQPNLVGRIEHEALQGALIADFNLIRPGALHRANGGYLILDASKVLANPFAWDDLKRALRSRQLAVEPPGQSAGLLLSVTLAPEPIPLDVKVVLIGEPMLYYHLVEADHEFADLFKVAADFDWRVPRTPEHEQGLARLLAGMIRTEKLRPLDAGAIARVVEEASREAEDSEKLSTNLASIADTVRSADHYAARAGAGIVGASHIQQAIEARIFRHDRVRVNVLEEVTRGFVTIDTQGEAVGQVNGLTVMSFGRFTFGHPARITCRVHLGRGDLLDIERETDLGGPLHSKGVMILSSFLSARFAQDHPLALGASLTFEQSHGEIEGDSASSAELYCLLSAISDLPLRQDIAVTGAVDQHGRVQAVGGINEKIEGFFDLCLVRGLSGRQGVVMPASNVRNLMLRADVVEACANRRFHIYAIETVDDGIELLTGLEAGVAGADGVFPSGTVNRRVSSRLSQYWRRMRVGPIDPPGSMPESPSGRGR